MWWRDGDAERLGTGLAGLAPARAWRRFRDHRLLRRALRPQRRQGVIVATCQNQPMAEVVAGRLREEGIKDFVFCEERGVGMLPVPAPVHVIVRPEDESAARELLS